MNRQHRTSKPLAALEKKYRWESDLARQDALRARHLVTRSEEARSQAEVRIEQIEEELRSILADSGVMDANAYGRWLAHLAECRAHAEQARKTLSEHEELYAQAREHLNGVERQRRMVAKHQGRHLARAATAQQRAEQKEADELWLLTWERP